MGQQTESQGAAPKGAGGGHTPGPWEVRHFNGVGVFATNNPAGNDATTYPIVDFGNVGGTRLAEFAHYGTPEANARLIAAAPELLEALGALGVIGNGYCFCSHDRDPDKAEHQPECRDARAALARATGAAS